MEGLAGTPQCRPEAAETEEAAAAAEAPVEVLRNNPKLSSRFENTESDTVPIQLLIVAKTPYYDKFCYIGLSEEACSGQSLTQETMVVSGLRT